MTQLFPGGPFDLKKAAWEISSYLKGKKIFSSEELERTLRKIIDGIDLQIEPVFEWMGGLEKRYLLLQVKTNKPFAFDEIIIKGFWKGKQWASFREKTTRFLFEGDTLSIQINIT